MLAEIADCFASAGVPAMALKGPALAISAYGDLAMRVFADLDFMVRVEDLPRAAAALGRAGYSSPSYRADIVESDSFPTYRSISRARTASSISIGACRPFTSHSAPRVSRSGIELPKPNCSAAASVSSAPPTRSCFRPAMVPSMAG